MVESNIVEITKIEELDNFDNEYVYDIGIDHPTHHWFFANNVLVHNSFYFTAWPFIKNDVESGKLKWGVEDAASLYDSFAESANQSFPAMMETSFHCPRELGSIIKCGREIVASRGLFITKKRYAALVVDKEGFRQDINGKPGKLKPVGLDLRRSDTPVVMQNFMKEILTDVLTGCDRDFVIEKITKFKREFTKLPPWEKGTPKRVNNLTAYRELEEQSDTGKANMPGHVRAAINWNRLKSMNSDNYSLSIHDGMKTIVCKLRDNPMGITSVGYPTDLATVQQLYRDLPFAEDEMETAIVDKKIDNLLGVLDWKLAEATDIKSTFNTLFSVK